MGLSTYVCVRKDHNSQLIKSNSVNIELRQHIQLINVRGKQRYTISVQYTNKQIGTRNIYKQEAKLTNYGVLSIL